MFAGDPIKEERGKRLVVRDLLDGMRYPNKLSISLLCVCVVDLCMSAVRGALGCRLHGRRVASHPNAACGDVQSPEPQW